MNKVYLGGNTTTEWEEIIEELVGIPCIYLLKTDNRDSESLKDKLKSHCNIHFYYIDQNSSGFEDQEIIASAENPNIHTLLQVNPDGLDFYQLKSRKELVEYVRNLDAFAIVHNDPSKSVKHINSIARIFDTVNQ